VSGELSQAKPVKQVAVRLSFVPSPFYLVAMADADDEGSYAQAVRFLTSLRSQKNQDVDAQRSFLQSKGLSEEVIARAFQDVKKPDSISEEVAAQAAGVLGSETDSEAFERAAEMFDKPLQAEAGSLASPPPPTAPPKTYPRSPLALYHQPQSGQPFKDDTISSPLTRYDVLLSFFRSMCYLLVLGGGVTGMIVALYRTYLVPRIVSTLDARSFLLKHHAEQYNLLANKIKTLRGNSLSPHSQIGTSAPLKGVLKKVQFADDVMNEKQAIEEEGKKEAGEKETIQEKIVALEDTKKSLSDSEEEAKTSESSEKISTIKPVDVMEPIRSSLIRLGQSLKADVSASAIGTDVVPAFNADPRSISTRPASTTVEEEGDADSWVSEDDSDELEFDPYSPSSSKNSKRKHNPAYATKAAASSTASSTTAVSLNSSLSTLNAYINSQTYMASANIYGGGRSIGMNSLGGSTASSGSEKEGSKAGDVAQIRADIRNLKGLLLSR
jgi:hypothetical protein